MHFCDPQIMSGIEANYQLQECVVNLIRDNFVVAVWGHSQIMWTAIVGGWVRNGTHSVHLYLGNCPPRVGGLVKKGQNCVHIVCE